MSAESSSWRTYLQFVGPGYLIAVGYLDPGNWATDLAAGSQFGYSLLFIILLSNIFAVLLQFLCVKLGVVTQRDLAQSCRAHFHPYVNFGLYVLCEAAIIACDLAEVIGTAIALNLLFKLPLVWGVVLTGLDVLVILAFFQSKYIRYFEAFIGLLVLTVAICFAILLAKLKPDMVMVLKGYIPSTIIFTDSSALYLALGILGATVMPHNLYLHSHLVKYRTLQKGSGQVVISSDDDATLLIRDRNIKTIIKFANIDSIVALSFALIVNSSILIVGAAAFHHMDEEVGDIPRAHYLLQKVLGQGAATLFAIGLFCSGQSSTITGTLAGQIVMEGFLGQGFRVPPWLRRLGTRMLAIVPALVVAIVKGNDGVMQLLIFSQVILSFQLPFAIWPLVYFTCSKRIMTDESLDCESQEEIESHENSLLLKVASVAIALLVTGLNILTLAQFNPSQGGH